MLTILIVEDDPDKRAAIERVISEVDELPPETAISTVRTASEARNALASRRFDVVVLDIALPQNEATDIDPAAGVGILDDLVGRPTNYFTPTHIPRRDFLTFWNKLVVGSRALFSRLPFTILVGRTGQTR
jgi:CheY-like chemotaxis protein